MVKIDKEAEADLLTIGRDQLRSLQIKEVAEVMSSQISRIVEL
jgi:hypothetical protein